MQDHGFFVAWYCVAGPVVTIALSCWVCSVISMSDVNPKKLELTLTDCKNQLWAISSGLPKFNLPGSHHRVASFHFHSLPSSQSNLIELCLSVFSGSLNIKSTPLWQHVPSSGSSWLRNYTEKLFTNASNTCFGIYFMVHGFVDLLKILASLLQVDWSTFWNRETFCSHYSCSPPLVK